MYDTVCKDRFDKLDKHNEDMLAILKGKNGDPGVLDQIREVKKFHRSIAKFTIFIGAAVLMQILHGVSIWVQSLIHTVPK